MNCPNCNNKLSDNVQFCDRCGAAQTVYDPPEGFELDSSSGLYYRHDTAGNHDTDLEWVTWFDANSGEYQQVSYPVKGKKKSTKAKSAEEPETEPVAEPAWQAVSKLIKEHKPAPELMQETPVEQQTPPVQDQKIQIPEGFTYDPEKKLYYVKTHGIDPITGITGIWVTYLHPETGEYQQTFFPSAPTPDSISQPAKPDPGPSITVETPKPAPQLNNTNKPEKLIVTADTSAEPKPPSPASNVTAESSKPPPSPDVTVKSSDKESKEPTPADNTTAQSPQSVTTPNVIEKQPESNSDTGTSTESSKPSLQPDVAAKTDAVQLSEKVTTTNATEKPKETAPAETAPLPNIAIQPPTPALPPAASAELSRLAPHSEMLTTMQSNKRFVILAIILIIALLGGTIFALWWFGGIPFF